MLAIYAHEGGGVNSYSQVYCAHHQHASINAKTNAALEISETLEI